MDVSPNEFKNRIEELLLTQYTHTHAFYFPKFYVQDHVSYKGFRANIAVQSVFYILRSFLRAN